MLLGELGLLAVRRAGHVGTDQHGLRHGVVAVVGEREQHAVAAPGVRDAPGAAAQDHGRRLAALSPHLELAPPYTHREAGAERLERRLLGGETSGVVLDGIAPALAIGNLTVGEDAPKEPLVPSRDDV